VSGSGVFVPELTLTALDILAAGRRLKPIFPPQSVFEAVGAPD
jgi:hypothetical protein